MKFSHTLSLNANPDWEGYYVDYAALKKVINELSAQQLEEFEIEQAVEKEHHRKTSSFAGAAVGEDDAAAAAALAEGGGSSSSAEPMADEETIKKERMRKKFLKKLKQMVDKIREFYYEKRSELDAEFAALQSQLEVQVKASSQDLAAIGSGDEDAGETTLPPPPPPPGPTGESVEMSPLLGHHKAGSYTGPISTATPPPATSGGKASSTARPSSTGSMKRIKSASDFQTHHETDDAHMVQNNQTVGVGFGRLMLQQLNKSRTSAAAAGVNHELEDIRREICDLFTQYTNLKTFATLNCTATRKIIKKYDKVMHDDLKSSHLSALKQMLPFWDGVPEIDSKVQVLVDYFAVLFCRHDRQLAAKKMNLMVREVITFQRRSVWLDVIEDRRKHDSIETTKIVPGVAGSDSAGDLSRIVKKEAAADGMEKRIGAEAGAMQQLEYQLKQGWTYIAKKVQKSVQVQLGLFCCLVFAGLLALPGIFDDDPVKRNALAMFVFVSLLWAGEVLPLFVTSMLIPFLTVVLRVLVEPGENNNGSNTVLRLDANATSKRVFSVMFDHVIMLLLGGFSIAAALSKHNIAKVVASSISRRCGSGIRTVLLVNMFVATVASMWISNVAAPVLCLSLIAPILKVATAEKSRAHFGSSQYENADNDFRLCRALVMGIALACNVGGMASPISSPQNLFAIEYTPIGWLSWFLVSIPLCIVLNTIIWVWLIYCFQLPSANSSAVAWALQRESGSTNEPFTLEQHFVIVVSVGVVLMWVFCGELAPVTGDMGVLAMIPFVLFFGSGILSKEDLNNFLWTVVILAMGGLVLGEAVKSSGLLDVVAHHIATFIDNAALSLWSTTLIFTALILICTTFVSHTVGAIVVLPIAKAVGLRMSPETHAKELVFAGALACSAAMGLPVSGFPNMTAVSVEDNLGNPFLSTKDFLKYAVPASVFSWIIITTVAYVLILEAVKIDSI